MSQGALLRCVGAITPRTSLAEAGRCCPLPPVTDKQWSSEGVAYSGGAASLGGQGTKRANTTTWSDEDEDVTRARKKMLNTSGPALAGVVSSLPLGTSGKASGGSLKSRFSSKAGGKVRPMQKLESPRCLPGAHIGCPAVGV